MPHDQRTGWPALRALDQAGGIDALRLTLERDPGLAIALAHDLGRRLPELEEIEDQIEQIDQIEQDGQAGGGDDQDQWPAPGM